MRLLEVLPNGRFRLEKFPDNSIPQYAILSHTWEADSQEVTFEDIVNGTGQNKAGFKKIKFCCNQTAEDGLQYFWVDSCCINKEIKAELSHAIKSMFRWYRDATRCYVYLTDVHTRKRKRGDENTQDTWEQAFLKSRWFTRGWTLQELLAPQSVEFFSQECQRLGDRSSLRQPIHEVTCIPMSALEGTPLSQFSVNERFSWIEHRQTKLEEDRSYSLLGIFGVSMPPLYGEGMASAFKRLWEEIDKLKKCMQALHLSDPRKDKRRIEESKGGLLVDSYHWILEHRDFKQWCDDQQSHLLWIKGDPGKGKTMLLCGIVNELNKDKPKSRTYLLSYFFCQATDSRINNATAVLRGLLYLLIDEQPSLISHVQQQYDHVGKHLFEDANAWVTLSEIFTNVLQDPALQNTYFIVDALDECMEGLPKLLDFITQKSSLSHAKWLISSRNRPDIEWRLDQAGDQARGKVKLCLELNAESVSVAVDVYIKHKVGQLAHERRYDEKIRKAVLEHLRSNANDTFLWVALVCQNLEMIPRWNVRAKLNTFPPGLDSLYERMMNQICDSDNYELCKQILAVTSIVYEPITLAELTSFVEMLKDMSEDPESLQEVIGHCGSFLVVRKDTIYFVHQSAKDYLLDKASAEIFPSGKQEGHYEVFSKSLSVMYDTLRRDIYEIHTPACLVEQIETPGPDPLAASRYSCIYWIDHVCDWNPAPANHMTDLEAGGTVDMFLRDKYLYWLEALSLCRGIPKGVLGMAKLETLVQKRVENPELLELVRDARRFIMYNKLAIEISPLQAYVSAITFSPVNSLIRRYFRKEEPKWITLKPAMGDKWSPCLQTLQGHGHFISSVVFSHDSNRLASASDDCTVKIWDAGSGECLQTLKGHSGHVRSVAFSHDSTWLASASNDRTLRIWNADDSECMRTFEGHTDDVTSIAFSHNSTRIASASDDATVRIWDTSSGKCVRTVEGHSNNKCINSVAFSHDSTRLVSASSDITVKIWDTNSGECLQTLEGHSQPVSSVAFSHDSALLASASNDHTLKIWNANNGKCIQTLEGHSDGVTSVAFSHDSTWLASASADCTVRIWDTISGMCLQTLEGHNDHVRSVSFSHNSTRLASASWDRMIRIWDTRGGEYLRTREGHSHSVNSVALSHDSTLLASASKDDTLRIWDASSGKCVRTLRGHSGSVHKVTFSHDSIQLASASWDRTIRTWDTSSGECLQTFEGHSHYVTVVVFSHNSTQLASASSDRTARTWDANSGECLQTFEGHGGEVTSVAFLHNSTRLASASWDRTVKIWDASSGECLQTLAGHSDHVHSVACSHDSTRLASASLDRTVRIWDANSGQCIQVLNIGHVSKELYNLTFDLTGSNLRTDIGTIAVDALSASNVVSNSMDRKDPRFIGVGLSRNGEWITHGSEKLMWLPSEYRPWCSAVSGRTISIGSGSGKVWMCCLQITGS